MAIAAFMSKAALKAAFLVVFFSLIVSISNQSRFNPDTSSNSNPIPNGVCDETWMHAYGILPCSTTFWGALFIVLLAGFFTCIASKLISSGSDLLMLGCGFGCCVFHHIVDALHNLVSGLRGSQEAAQQQVQNGMGLLAGSTVVLLLLWGFRVVVGSGVTTDAPTPQASKFQNSSHGEIAEGVGTRTWVFKALSMLLLGIVIAFIFADPLVESVTDFSNVTNIRSFSISFIAMPLATITWEAVFAIIIASKKKQQTPSVTLSQIYGEVRTNNLIRLAVFLALVYVRHLTWDFSAEVLVILFVYIAMGLLTSFSTTYPRWTCSIAFLLYASSLVLIYVLKWP